VGVAEKLETRNPKSERNPKPQTRNGGGRESPRSHRGHGEKPGEEKRTAEARRRRELQKRDTEKNKKTRQLDDLLGSFHLHLVFLLFGLPSVFLCVSATLR
jgi:hypothetical protein